MENIYYYNQEEFSLNNDELTILQEWTFAMSFKVFECWQQNKNIAHINNIEMLFKQQKCIFCFNFSLFKQWFMKLDKNIIEILNNKDKIKNCLIYEDFWKKLLTFTSFNESSDLCLN